MLGGIAIAQIQRRGEKGRRAAILGIAFGVGWAIVAIVVAVVAFVAVVTNYAERDASGRIVEAGYVDVTDLRPGDCIDGLKEGEVLLDGVRCDEPHDVEVVGRFDLHGVAFPGAGSVRRRASAGCRRRLEAYAPREYDAVIDDATFVAPDRTQWEAGDHEIVCFANLDPKRTTSLRR